MGAEYKEQIAGNPSFPQEETYYQILGVSPSSSQIEISKAYRKLALKEHPDKIKDSSDEAKARFIKIKDAYEVIGNAQKKKEYDFQRYVDSRKIIENIDFLVACIEENAEAYSQALGENIFYKAIFEEYPYFERIYNALQNYNSRAASKGVTDMAIFGNQNPFYGIICLLPCQSDADIGAVRKFATLVKFFHQDSFALRLSEGLIFAQVYFEKEQTIPKFVEKLQNFLFKLEENWSPLLSYHFAKIIIHNFLSETQLKLQLSSKIQIPLQNTNLFSNSSSSSSGSPKVISGLKELQECTSSTKKIIENIDLLAAYIEKNAIQCGIEAAGNIFCQVLFMEYTYFEKIYSALQCYNDRQKEGEKLDDAFIFGPYNPLRYLLGLLSYKLDISIVQKFRVLTAIIPPEKMQKFLVSAIDFVYEKQSVINFPSKLSQFLSLLMANQFTSAAEVVRQALDKIRKNLKSQPTHFKNIGLRQSNNPSFSSSSSSLDSSSTSRQRDVPEMDREQPRKKTRRERKSAKSAQFFQQTLPPQSQRISVPSEFSTSLTASSSGSNFFPPPSSSQLDSKQNELSRPSVHPSEICLVWVNEIIKSLDELYPYILNSDNSVRDFYLLRTQIAASTLNIGQLQEIYSVLEMQKIQQSPHFPPTHSIFKM